MHWYRCFGWILLFFGLSVVWMVGCVDSSCGMGGGLQPGPCPTGIAGDASLFLVEEVEDTPLEPCGMGGGLQGGKCKPLKRKNRGRE